MIPDVHRVAAAVVATILLSAAAASHELERTRVVLALQPDGGFVLDVANDPNWLLLRLETFAGGAIPPNITPAERDRRLAQLGDVFADRIVLFVDAHEVRASRVEYRPPAADGGELAAYRLTGVMPRDATRLRWLYGLVADPYPLEIRRPDGSSTVEWIEGTNWSGVIDLSQAFTRPARFEIARQYLWLGYTHILPKGLDHILFVLGIFLLSARWRTMVLQVTAFTVAHSITLALSIYGVVSMPPRIVEPLIALSIAYVAIENLLTRELKPWRLALVFMFGLLHGLGFAGVLRDLGLPREEFVTALVTFNLGVEGGQLTVIAIAWLAVLPLIGKGWYRRRVVVPASMAIAAIGLYWTLVRAVDGTNFWTR
jgi:hydrogenase/urease accessory protein HupE